jgi:8-oxo-dGTP pyrophosphatase MutT (NUDIX family)
MKRERYKITTAVYAVIMEEGRLLMLLRQNTGFMDGKYGLVSGHLEANETLAEALAREAKEEANIIIEKIHLGMVLFRFRVDSESDDYVDFFFIVDDYKGKISNNEPDRCRELKFFPLDDLPKNTIDYISYCIENLLKGTTYCEWFPGSKPGPDADAEFGV